MFGGLWSFLAATGLPKGLRLPAEGVGFLVTIALVASLWKRSASGGSSAGFLHRRGYIVAVSLEVVAICAASALLTRYGLKSYFIQAVGVIVGLHFIGLWQATRSSRFLWIAACMSGVSALSACLPGVWNGFDPRDVVTGFGNALVLWIGAGSVVRGDGSSVKPSPL